MMRRRLGHDAPGPIEADPATDRNYFPAAALSKSFGKRFGEFCQGGLIGVHFQDTPLVDHTQNPSLDLAAKLGLCDIDPSRPMTAAARAVLPILGNVSIDGVPYITLTYGQNSLLTGASVNLQTSTDLKRWQTVDPDFIQYLATNRLPAI